MTFNDNADISAGKTSKVGRNAAIIGGGGGGLLVVVLLVVSQLTGVDLTGLAPQTSSTSDSSTADNLSSCKTGADANADLDCRIKGASASLDVFWSTEAPKLGISSYASPAGVELFTDQTSTGCGDATTDVGPFYCPVDRTIYLDTGFFDELKTTFGASGGPLSQMYVIAHEWGHHIQNLAGILDRNQSGATGAGSQSVRIELQADCFAGAWIASATQTKDENGVTFLKPVTDAELKDALSAASAVGDDRIQQDSGQSVNSESWTHGSSAQRQKWLMNGYNGGASACDTFTPSAANL